MRKPLFTGLEFSQLEHRQLAELKAAVGQLEGEELQEANRPALVSRLVRRFELRVPILSESEIRARELDPGSNRVPYEFLSDEALVGAAAKASVVEIAVPISGDEELLKVTPTEWTLVRPIAEIRDGSLVFTYPMQGQSGEETRRDLDRDLANVQNYLGRLRRDCDAFNANLTAKVESAIARRLEALGKSADFMTGLGIPNADVR